MKISLLIPGPTLREKAIRPLPPGNVASAAGREDYVPCKLVERDGDLFAEPIFFKINLIFTLVKADGLLIVPLDKTGLEANDTVSVMLF